MILEELWDVKTSKGKIGEDVDHSIEANNTPLHQTHQNIDHNNEVTNCRENWATNDDCTLSQSLSVLEEIEKLKRQNEELKSNLTCKVCLDAPVGDVFFPCRHLVCCVSCSPSLSKCPLCREPIIGTIKVFV